MEKFGKLLEHWIEHNEEHIESYKKWIKNLNPELAELLEKAVRKFEEGNSILKEIMKKLDQQ
ncbi:MAG: hypothetical protein HA490_00115 [Archaeoglobales archaeon]|jgi:exonuclease VII small subunit|nr:hypothetical protein [Archaeoglobales archaeon]TDA29042.1 MAG: hypothetical protein DSN99_00445 [Archaeoglobi archaeon]